MGEIGQQSRPFCIAISPILFFNLAQIADIYNAELVMNKKDLRNKTCLDFFLYFCIRINR